MLCEKFSRDENYGRIAFRDLKLLGISTSLRGELQHENNLISSERAFRTLEKDMYIAGIGQAVLELLSFKVGSGNHQRESPTSQI